MARSAAFEPLRDSNFYIYDVAPIDALSLPIFTPLFGFQSISSPEITIETEEIREANNPYPTEVVTGASVSPLTLTRGVSFVDSDFWRWIRVAISGNTGGSSSAAGLSNFGEIGGFTYRRTLLLLHFFRNLPLPYTVETVVGADGKAYTSTVNKRTMEAALALGVSGGVISVVAGSMVTNAKTAMGVSAVQLAALGTYIGLGGLGDWATIPVPARAFLLKDCIPTRYKAGSDFDAASGQVSIAELEIHPHYVEEISLFA